MARPKVHQAGVPKSGVTETPRKMFRFQANSEGKRRSWDLYLYGFLGDLAWYCMISWWFSYFGAWPRSLDPTSWPLSSQNPLWMVLLFPIDRDRNCQYRYTLKNKSTSPLQGLRTSSINQWRWVFYASFQDSDHFCRAGIPPQLPLLDSKPDLCSWWRDDLLATTGNMSSQFIFYKHFAKHA